MKHGCILLCKQYAFAVGRSTGPLRYTTTVPSPLCLRFYMSERRVDKSDPRMVAAIRPLTIPKAWEEEQRVSIYETMLSSMSYVQHCEYFLTW